MNYTRDKKILLTVYFLFYYAVFLSFFLDERLLSQYQPILLNYNRDLTELALIATGLPGWLIAHPGGLMVADALVLLLPIVLLGYAILRKGRFSVFPGVLFAGFLAIYLLLADVFWQVHHEPFILYLLLSFAFLTNRADRFYGVLKGCRYYFLYGFVSAAWWKIARGSVFNGEEMSRILLIHHSDLLTGDCTSFSCRVYGWLIGHPGVSWWLYLGATALELCFLAGFFTRRWDRWLIGLAVLFVLADLLLMRIPYWTILLGTVTLWLGGGARGAVGPAERGGLVIYETTHHENLPALLDLGEAHFSRVAVFLKEVSYRNLCGGNGSPTGAQIRGAALVRRDGAGSPEERWPKTVFVIQAADCGNRRFIGQLFGFLGRQRYSHLHLATLDNNLLLFAIRLACVGPVHVSLTVHEVNEYFSFSFRGLRDTSESVAKVLLHRLIRHYTVFLPAMAERLAQRLPGVTVVFIPSRFYASQRWKPENTFFKVVIPGSVDPNRRNYSEVVEAFTRLVPGRPIELVILGDSSTGYGAGIVAGLRRLESDGFRLRCFEGYIPGTVYEQELTSAHLIWSPLNLHKKSSRNSGETYGQTTASGLTADLLGSNAPALVPEGFIIPEPFRAAIFSYGSPEEWRDIVGMMINDPAHYSELRERIHSALSFFTKENFGEAFSRLMGATRES